MNILVVGSGAREHTLVWKLAQSEKADKIYAVPGNPGMAELAECIEGVSITDNAALVKLAQECPDKLILCPHQAGITLTSFHNVYRMLFENLGKLMAGERPDRVVNGL